MISKTDILYYIPADDLDQITGEDDSIIDFSIEDAENYAKEYLRPRFDVETEFLKTGIDRNKSLLNVLVHISIYLMFERLNTNVLPEARSDSYNRSIQWLKDVSSGKLETTLTEKTSPENEKGYAIRWGSSEKKINTKL